MKRKHITIRKAMPYILLLPGTIFLIMFMFYPLISIFRYSMMNYDMSNLRKKGYIGFANLLEITETKKPPIKIVKLPINNKKLLEIFTLS